MPLTRTLHKMPDYIRDTLTERKLLDAYHERPDYQQNDYLGWITRSKRQETRDKRLAQMLDELAGGKLYMSMLWAKSHTLQRRPAKEII
jgi:uncharacterized protein YdeI (YjbR/CyaY-like superfamily)